MKFKDIPQFTSEGNYQVNQPLKTIDRFIKEEIEEVNLQLNPDFQRGHIWNEKQQIAFIEYLLKGGKAGRDIYFNNPNQRRNRNNNYKDYVCVDGLQRLTTCLRFLNNEIPAFNVYYEDFEDRLTFDPNLIIHVNDLQTKAEVLKWYIEMNEGGTPHSEKEIERVKNLLEEERSKNIGK